MSEGGGGGGTAGGSLGLGCSSFEMSGDALLIVLGSGTLGASALALFTALSAALLASLPAFSAASRVFSVVASRVKKPFCWPSPGCVGPEMPARHCLHHQGVPAGLWQLTAFCGIPSFLVPCWPPC